ncbi:MAG: hypothetical protein ACP5KI_04790 [Brevinematia bacterium]
MKARIFKFSILVITYIASGILIYMALTNSGIFQKRLETKFKSISNELAISISKKINSCVSATTTLSRDTNIKLILYQKDISGNRRDYINYLSRLRSSIKYVYKIILLDKNENFLISSDYSDSEFKEFELAKKYIKDDIGLFGNINILYTISKVYDDNGLFLGYIAIGWYEDFLKTILPKALQNIKFVQDLILVNPTESIYKNIQSTRKESVYTYRQEMFLFSKPIKDYNLSIVFFKNGFELDFLNIITVVIVLVLALLITLWFIIDLIEGKKVEFAEEIKDSVFSNIEGSFSNIYESESNIYIDEKKKEELKKLAEELTNEEDRYKYEEIEANIVTYQGNIQEREVSTIEEIFDYIVQKLGVEKIMFLRRTEDGFTQIKSRGFETQDFYISFSDKVWDKFLSKGKAVSIKGDIKELYELGPRIKDDLFEIIIFPIIDSFGEVRSLFLAGRKWTENEAGLEAKKEIYSRIKNLIIE